MLPWYHGVVVILNMTNNEYIRIGAPNENCKKVVILEDEVKKMKHQPLTDIVVEWRSKLKSRRVDTNRRLNSAPVIREVEAEVEEIAGAIIRNIRSMEKKPYMLSPEEFQNGVREVLSIPLEFGKERLEPKFYRIEMWADTLCINYKKRFDELHAEPNE